MAERERTADSSPGGPDLGEVEVRRSKRRRRTVSAYRDGDRVIVLLPARMSRAEERRWVGVMVDRIQAQEARRRPSDEQLLARAEQLNRRYLNGRAVPNSVRWVGNQATRWGSCTPSDRTVRLSSRLKGMPSWVVDYVLLHELAHLVHPGHGPRFWELLGGFSRTERARGYLEGVAAAASLGIEPCGEAGRPPLEDDVNVDHSDSGDHPVIGDDPVAGDHSVTGWVGEADEPLAGQSDG